MAGIYIHIPFCRQACLYCGFHFSTQLQGRGEMLRALSRELELQQDFFAGEGGQLAVDTLYFGGGTPSVVEAAGLAQLVDRVRSLFPVAADAEVTLEANPDDISPRALEGWLAAGVTRLSVGIQSFYAEDLRWMNRAHDDLQAAGCLSLIPRAGFDNYSCDLIYGYPLLTDEKWEANIARMVDAGVPHLSCYALTVEPRTALEHRIRAGRAPAPDDGQAARQFHILAGSLAGAGYAHYEVSNFARPGCRSRHNSHYWEGVPYLGIGPSAHSFRPGMRQWNIANNAGYVAALQAGRLPFEREYLTAVMQLNEYVMTSLRTSEGCDLERVERRWGTRERSRLERAAAVYVARGHMRTGAGRLVLTGEGLLFSDGIASALFSDEPA